MAVLRRRKLLLVICTAFILVVMATFVLYNTNQDQRLYAIEDGKSLHNNVYHNIRSEDRKGDLFDQLLSRDFLQYDDTHVSSVEEKMVIRKKQVETVCAMMKENNVSPPNQLLFRHEDLKHLIVDDNHQILYCFLPKVANTNFRRVFLGLQGVVPKSNVGNISGYEIYFKYDKTFKYLKSFKPPDQSTLLRTYKKFIIVRDPLERLLSGYRNKFFHPNKGHKAEYHDRVTAFYRNHPHLIRRNNVRTDFRSGELSFREFLLYMTDVYEVNEYLNEHFVPSNQLCNPCNIRYDYVGKYESLETDVKYIFDHLNIDIDFPGRNDNYSSISTSSLVEEYYKPIPEWLLHKTWDIIKFDSLLFGFHLPKWFRDKLNGI
ncbi:carbohydrate sulfotransferase 11-like [Ruditapes philippinarum]|uniref:carbohydrate sulfotransferase 11-like n=1 Tax=Ruditapes philippinarum TaxID=129788 RepID=UPI00295B6F50|nr:carbohydrate sulfotransferase 11-like [Ruditapes philippinarum]XP_060552655.1 carbohydrate sulfotransferase 11-like [Ruditapes philippinarum]XP_060552665.1 carbohydrate sulfotransferase 11-like [Ruditapes philippinarum]